MFEANLNDNLLALERGLKSGSYQPLPLRRHLLDKGGGKFRPLGIPAVRDRVAQEVVRRLLTPIFEPLFHEASFGFRPKRNCHQALELTLQYHQQGYRVLLDADIDGFFDHLPQALIKEAVAAQVADGNILNLIEKFLRAGVLDKGVFQPTTMGTPQGGVISPLLAVLSQAPIHSANAEVMATGALVGAETGAVLTLSSSLPGDIKPASNHPFVLDLPKILRRSANHADWRAGGQLSVQRTESETVPGTCGGSLSYNLTVNDATGDFVGVFVFSDYCDDGITLNGRVDADGSIDLIASEFDIINFHFDNLSSADFVFAGDISLDETGPSSLITMDSLLEDTISNKVYWFKDYVMTVTEINGVGDCLGVGVFQPLGAPYCP